VQGGQKFSAAEEEIDVNMYTISKCKGKKLQERKYFNVTRHFEGVGL
jgi:hypothetical protein